MEKASRVRFKHEFRVGQERKVCKLGSENVGNIKKASSIPMIHTDSEDGVITARRDTSVNHTG